MGERDYVEELRQQRTVVEVAFNNEDFVFGQQSLTRSFQRRVVVLVKVVEAEDAIAALLQSEGAVGSDEAAGASDEDGEPVGAAGSGGVADLLLPGRAGAVEGGGEEVVVGVDVGGVVGRRKRRVVEGEEEDKHQRDQKGCSE